MSNLAKEEQEKEYVYDEVLRFGSLVIMIPAHCVVVAGQSVSLTVKEFDLLVALASAPGRVFTRKALLKQVWDYSYLGKSRTVDVHIASLRKKLEGVAGGLDYIQTVWGKGYKFVSPSLTTPYRFGEEVAYFFAPPTAAR
jgi:two-component system response regulator ResD